MMNDEEHEAKERFHLDYTPGSLTELRFYVPQIISETVFPANLLALY